MWSVGEIGLSSVGCAGHVVCPIELPELCYRPTVGTECNRLPLLAWSFHGHRRTSYRRAFTSVLSQGLYMYLRRTYIASWDMRALSITISH